MKVVFFLSTDRNKMGKLTYYAQEHRSNAISFVSPVVLFDYRSTDINHSSSFFVAIVSRGNRCAQVAETLIFPRPTVAIHLPGSSYFSASPS